MSGYGKCEDFLRLLLISRISLQFPLMSRSKKLHDLITNRESRAAGGGEQDEEEEEDAGEIREEEVVLEVDEDSDVHRIRLPDFPGGAEAFEQAAKFCYGVKLDLTPATAAPLRCAAERLGMSDDHSDNNLISILPRRQVHVPHRPEEPQGRHPRPLVM